MFNLNMTHSAWPRTSATAAAGDLNMTQRAHT
eukprot:COSAG05_NODE_24509_length_251_cov_0.631579_1_plen_31_part_10